MTRQNRRGLLISLVVLIGSQVVGLSWADNVWMDSTLGLLHSRGQLPVETDGLAEVGEGEGEYQEELL